MYSPRLVLTVSNEMCIRDSAWDDLKRVNDWVNHTIKSETDMDHYGMIQWWRYPDDGIGAGSRPAPAQGELVGSAELP